MRKETKGQSMPRGGKVTLEMVAQASGVSPGTVSRILNGTAIVSDDKRAAVDHAIAELGFVPDPMARGLSGGRTMSMGVITQTIDSPFYGVALRGIEEAMGQAGYSALFASGHWDAETEKRCIETLRVRRGQLRFRGAATHHRAPGGAGAGSRRPARPDCGGDPVPGPFRPWPRAGRPARVMPAHALAVGADGRLLGA